MTKHETIYFLETRVNLSMDWDLERQQFRPTAELVIVGYSPVYRVPGTGKGRTVKEMEAHTQRIKLSMKSCAELEQSIANIRAQMEQFEKLGEFINTELVRKPGAPPADPAQLSITDEPQA